MLKFSHRWLILSCEASIFCPCLSLLVRAPLSFRVLRGLSNSHFDLKKREERKKGSEEMREKIEVWAFSLNVWKIFYFCGINQIVKRMILCQIQK